MMSSGKKKSFQGSTSPTASGPSTPSRRAPCGRHCYQHYLTSYDASVHFVALPINAKALEAFDAAPDGFVFVSADLNKSDTSVASLGACSGSRPACQPVIKHGICHLDVARGLLLAHKARAVYRRLQQAREEAQAAFVLASG